jgi:hypothetical protein
MGTAIDGLERQWWGRCCRKRRLKNRLMVRGRDPQGFALRVASGVCKGFRGQRYDQDQYCRAP